MQIEIFSDVVCPWCYIGKRRMDAVLGSPAGEGLTVTWRPFQLYPQIPQGGIPRDTFMAARFGEDADPAAIYSRVVAEAESEGLDLDFEGIRVAPNTFDAHRLLSWAELSGHQHDLAEVLFRFYFREGRDVGDPSELRAAAAEAGLDADAARELLSSDDEADKVRSELSLAQAVGVTGVPFFVLGGRFAVPGAQSRETLAQLVARARERLAADGPGTG